MPTMFVVAESLNVRSSPSSKNQDNIIGKLYLTQSVELVSQPSSGWIEIEAANTDPGADGTIRGYVSMVYLRQPTTSNREALVASASQEYFRFARGKGKEHIKPYAQYVGEMWRAINIRLDGTDRDTPWSAAAISFFVRNAGGAYSRFGFAAAHSKFIYQAIKAREKKDANEPFWGFRLHEVRPQIGDIVARDNPQYLPQITYEIASKIESYRSHTDLIVHIDSAQRRAIAIGGNVSDSVGLAYYDLAPGDFLDETKHTFALLRNMTDG